MRIPYDSEVDALYIRLRETKVTTKELGGGIAVDLDAEGNLAGIEILDSEVRMGDKGALRIVRLEAVRARDPVSNQGVISLRETDVHPGPAIK